MLKNLDAKIVAKHLLPRVNEISIPGCAFVIDLPGSTSAGYVRKNS